MTHKPTNTKFTNTLLYKPITSFESYAEGAHKTDISRKKKMEHLYLLFFTFDKLNREL